MNDPLKVTDILRIVLAYALFASLWIVFSDQLLGTLITDREHLIALATAKGFLFVVVTSLLLYVLLQQRFLGKLPPKTEDDRLPAGLFAWPRWSFYALASLMAAAGIALRLQVAVHFGDRPLLVIMVLPIILAGTLGGFGPALLATILTSGAAAWFLPPENRFAIAAGHDLGMLMLFIANGLLIGLLCEAMHHSRLEEMRQRRQLEQSQMALRESEARFRTTFEQAAVGIAHVAPDGRWLKVNQSFCEIVGYTAEELLTRSFQDITHPDDLATDLAQLRRLLQGEITSYALEKRYMRRDGSLVWVHLTVALVRKPDGTPEHFISVVEDITARKAAEEELKQRNAELSRFNRASIDRELRMIRLKREVNELAQALGRPPPYDLSFADETEGTT